MQRLKFFERWLKLRKSKEILLCDFQFAISLIKQPQIHFPC